MNENDSKIKELNSMIKITESKIGHSQRMGLIYFGLFLVFNFIIEILFPLILEISLLVCGITYLIYSFTLINKINKYNKEIKRYNALKEEINLRNETKKDIEYKVKKYYRYTNSYINYYGEEKPMKLVKRK